MFLDEWDSWTYQVLVKICSDHSPILASLTSNSLRKINNFRFFSMWLQDTSCLKLILDSLDNKVVGCPMFILQHKFKRLEMELWDWNKNSFGNIHNAVCLILMGFFVKKTLLRRSLIMLFTINICFGRKGLRCYGLKMEIEILLFPCCGQKEK